MLNSFTEPQEVVKTPVSTSGFQLLALLLPTDYSP